MSFIFVKRSVFYVVQYVHVIICKLGVKEVYILLEKGFVLHLQIYYNIKLAKRRSILNVSKKQINNGV